MRIQLGSCFGSIKYLGFSVYLTVTCNIITLLGVNLGVNSFFTIHGECSFILHYSWIVLHYPRIVNCSMDSVNEHFTYPWIINSSIYVQLDELV